LRNFASFSGRCELGEKDISFREFATSPQNNASTGFGGRLSVIQRNKE